MGKNTVVVSPAVEYTAWERVGRALRAAGEFMVPSRLRMPNAHAVGLTTGGIDAAYRLESRRVDYDLARALYRNTHDSYKLGGAFAKPVVNAAAAFMGAPIFRHPDDGAQAALTEAAGAWHGALLKVNRNTLRDGDCFVRVERVDDPVTRSPRFELRLLPPEWCAPDWEPLTRAWRSLTIKHPVRIEDRDPVSGLVLRVQDTFVTETITPQTITVRADDQAPEELHALDGERSNPWGFVPVVHFRNEAEESELFGSSELEPIEPFMKAYHDVMLHAIGGSRLFSRPKIKFKLSDVAAFLRNNFSDAEIRAGKLNFKDKELFLMAEKDDAEFISGETGEKGYAQLLELIYFCIVDASETPEFVFGTAVQASKGSVAEQMVPLLRKIERKRGEFAPSFAALGAMYLAMRGLTVRALVPTASGAVLVAWDEVSQKDEVNLATAIRTTAEGLNQAIKGGYLSVEAAAEHFRKLVGTMRPWEGGEGVGEGERDRVLAGLPHAKRVMEEIGAPERDQGKPPGPNSTARDSAGNREAA